MPSRTDQSFKQQIADELKGVAANYRDYLFVASVRYIKALEPAAFFRGWEDDEIWGDDPIHPEEAACGLLADSVVGLAEGMLSLCGAGMKRPRSGSDGNRGRDSGDSGGERSRGWKPLGCGCYMRFSGEEAHWGCGRGRPRWNQRRQRRARMWWCWG
jgi:hypothetical protein